MSLSTHSKFYYGYEITEENNALDFSEGGSELQATLDVGSYTLTTILDAIAIALNDVGALTYTVSVNRDTRLITIASTSNFELLVSTGSRSGSSVFSTIGFSGSDKTGALTYTASAAAGSEYRTQFILQSYVDTNSFVDAAEGTVNTSASGLVEVYRFGQNQFMEANFTYITDRVLVDGAPIRKKPSGVLELQTLMRHFISKAPFEFMPNEDDSATFETMILESTPDNKSGIGFKLKELYTKNLPGFYETGVLKFRKIQ